jgi:phage terminase small subunit
MARSTNLTTKQQRFVEEFLVDLNATQSAVRAGYSKANADKIGPALLGNSRVSVAIAFGLKAKSAETKITKTWVVQRAVAAVDAATDAQAHSAVLRGIELLAKLHGHLIERRDVRSVRSWADLTDEELEALRHAGVDERP